MRKDLVQKTVHVVMRKHACADGVGLAWSGGQHIGHDLVSAAGWEQGGSGVENGACRNCDIVY